MNCRVCGTPLDVSDTRCASCGALAVADDELWQAARAADEPTQVMPAVERPSEPIVTDSPPTAGYAALPAPPQTAPPAVEPAPAIPPPAVGPPSVLVRRPGGMWREVMIAAIGGALALLVLAGVWVVVNRPSSSPEAVAASETAESSAVPGAVAGVSCAPRSLSATSTGRWRLYRAEFGPREQVDSLRLLVRRDGDHELVPQVTAELVAPGDVQSRYEVEMPAGDQALVLAFNGPVGIGGSWGATPNYRGLREFRVTRGREGNVFVVAGIVGSGCFALSGGWEGDESEIRIEIDRP